MQLTNKEFKDIRECYKFIANFPLLGFGEEKKLFEEFYINRVVFDVPVPNGEKIVKDGLKARFYDFSTKGYSIVDGLAQKVDKLGVLNNYSSGVKGNGGAVIEIYSGNSFKDRQTFKGKKRLIFQTARGNNIKNRIIEANLALVPFIIHKKVEMWDPDYEDYISEGFLSLETAVDNFDLKKGANFSTYACRGVFLEVRNLRRYFKRNIGKGFYSQSVNENVKDKILKEIPDNHILRKERDRFGISVGAKLLEEVDDICDKKEALVLRLIFVGGKSLKEVGDIIGFSRMTASKIRDDGIKKLRKSFGVEGF